MTSTNDHADVSLSMDVNLPLGYGSGRIEFGKKIVLSVQGKKIAVPEHVFWNKAALTEFVNLQMDLHRTLTGETLRSFSIEASNIEDVQRHDAGEEKIRTYAEAETDLTVEPVGIEATANEVYYEMQKRLHEPISKAEFARRPGRLY
jgi:hypothetical protein